MRSNQKTRLTNLTDELTEVLIEESNPVNWPAHGKKIEEMETVEHRSRLAHKQNASATVGLILRIQQLLGIHQKSGVKEDVETLETHIKKAEEEAARILNQMH